jgi:hypothetical protein
LLSGEQPATKEFKKSKSATVRKLCGLSITIILRVSDVGFEQNKVLTESQTSVGGQNEEKVP